MHSIPDTLPTIVTSTGRRIRGDSKLDRLTPEQKANVRYLLVEERQTYQQVAEFLRARFGVQVGRSAVGLYYRRNFLPEQYAIESDVAVDVSQLKVGEFDALTVNHARILAFSALTEPSPRIDTAARLLDLVHRHSRQQIAEKRLALEERRMTLREQELAAHPPAQARSSHSELPSPSRTPSRPSHPVPPSPAAPTPESGPPDPRPDLAETSVQADAAPSEPESQKPSPAAPPPSHANGPESFGRVDASARIDDPDFHPPPQAPSQKSQPNPPLFPGSSGINPPPPTASSSVDRNDFPSVNSPPATAPRVPLSANLAPQHKLHLCSEPAEAPPIPPRPSALPIPKPRIPYREVTRAEWG